MQIPKRRHQLLKIQQDEGIAYLTPAAIKRMQEDIVRLERVDRPKIVEDLSFALKLGDLSENAEYQDAKARLGRIDGRIFGLKERMKRAVAIESGSDEDGKIRIGSTVLLAVDGKQRSYQIVGSHESNPSQGRISYMSPLGTELIGHAAGESVSIEANGKNVSYGIIEVT